MGECTVFSPDRYKFFCPVKTNSGSRALEHLPFELDTMNATKPFVITSQKDARRGLVDVIIDAFKDSGVTIGIFDGTPAAPGMKLIKELFTMYRDGGYDSLIAVGGGAVVDTAKILNIAVSGEPEDIERYAGIDLITKPLKPLVLVPTLSGTGYESSRYACIDTLSISSCFLMPHLVVIDPRMTVFEDVETTAAASLIALTHAVEVYTGPEKNLLSDSYAYTAIRFVMENLVNVIRDPGDGKGRLALVNAHNAAGCAFSNSTPGMAHRLGRAVGDACQLSWGLCMGILLPHVLERQISEDRYHIPGLLLPLAGFDMYAETPEHMRVQKAIGILYDFQRHLFEASRGTIVRSLKDAEVPEEMLQDIARKAAGSSSTGFGADMCLMVLEQAWKGK